MSPSKRHKSLDTRPNPLRIPLLRWMMQGKSLVLLCLLIASSIVQASIGLASALLVVDDDIQMHLRENEYQIISLNEGDIKTDIPVISFASRQAMTKGTIVLIADLHAQQVASSHFYKLANQLPNWGWNTLLVTPKDKYFGVTPKAKEALAENLTQDDPNQSLESESQTAAIQEPQEPNAPELSDDGTVLADEDTNQAEIAPANAALSEQTGLKAFTFQQAELNYSKEDYTNFIALLLSQINTTFLQQPGYQILMVEGQTASVAINLLNTNPDITVNALVLSNPYWPENTANHALPLQLANLQLPVLDLVSASDNNWSLQTQAKRLEQTRIMVKPFYRQREIVSKQSDDVTNEYLTRQIVGWTRYLGW
jgi:hypothetical protein